MRDKAWVDALRAKILSDDDKSLFEEVIKCYEQGLYRSGYITAWVLLAESLKRKIYYLASVGDARSIKAKSDIEQDEANHNSTDRKIFDSCKDCEIISIPEHTIISELWNQRCIFAHPYQYTASDVDLEYIMAKMIELSLAKDVKYTSQMIDERFESYWNNVHIIPVDKTEICEDINAFLLRVQDKHLSRVFKSIHYYLSKALNSGNAKYRFYLMVFSKLFADALKEDINVAKYRVNDALTKSPYESIVMFMCPSI